MKMSSIITITFINKEIKPTCSDEDLIRLLNQSKTEFFICPKSFEELKDKVNLSFKPKNKSKLKLFLSYNAIYQNGEKKEITDDLELNKNIFYIFVCYKKKSGKHLIIPQNDLNSLFSEEDLNVELNFPEKIDIDNTFNINEFLKIKEAVPQEIKLSQDNLFNSCIENINTSFNDELSKSATDLLNLSIKNINKNYEDLRKSVNLSTKNLIQRRNSALDVLKKNTEDIKEINKSILRYNANRPEPEEKIIFRFNESLIKLEQEINKNDTKKTIKIKNIHIKNISRKEYNSTLMAWIKEDNSSEKINFNQEEINEIFPFQNEDKYQSQQDINDLYLNLLH